MTSNFGFLGAFAAIAAGAIIIYSAFFGKKRSSTNDQMTSLQQIQYQQQNY